MIERITTLPPLPPRPRDGHKGLFGRILVVGGNESMIGAPVLAGTAALRMGAGLVQIAMPRAVLPFALSITPELIGLGLDKSSSRALLEAAEAADVIVVGPGLGQSTEASRTLQALLRMEKRMIVDADALNLLAGERQWPADFMAQAILTPHPGEMARLTELLARMQAVEEPLDGIPTDDDSRIELACAAAQATRQTVVLKGHRTVVTDGERVYVNQTGDSTLSKAGAGDVLCGIMATLFAQMPDPFDAAALAVNLHGRAGELAGQRLGRRSALARDVIDALVDVLRDAAVAPAE